jgi:hypothetical protein
MGRPLKMLPKATRKSAGKASYQDGDISPFPHTAILPEFKRYAAYYQGEGQQRAV